MKFRLGLVACALCALVGALLPLAPPAQAQPAAQVPDYVSAMADFVVNGTVISTDQVEIDGMPRRVSRINVTSAVKGSLDGEILVEVPGGQRADGSGIYISHMPDLAAEDEIQIALTPADSVLSAVLPVALELPLAAYSVVGGESGVANVLPTGVWVAEAGGGYAHSGFTWPTFTSPQGFLINPSNSGVSSSATISAIRAGFAAWEDDLGSLIDFSYAGTTSASGVNFSDNQNVVSWVNAPGAGWLGQAWVEFDSNGVIYQFDIQMNTSFNWTIGASPNQFDIETVIAHEVGHGVGFDHVGATSELMFGTIFSNTTKDLGAGDREGAAVIYQGSRFRSQDSGSTGGGSEAGDDLGHALVTGDFNNDGREDAAIGAPGENSDAGGVTVFLGTSWGLSSNGTTFTQSSSGVYGSSESGDRFGEALAAGDFDNDGFDDLAIGVPGEDVGSISNAGAVVVLYGRSSGISGSGSEGFTQDTGAIPGNAESGDGFGAALAAGDFDGDGDDDLAVGAPNENIGSTSNSGLVTILQGGSGGVSSNSAQSFHQATAGVVGASEPNDLFGYALAAGNFDGDSRSDLAIGVPGEDIGSKNGVGTVVVLEGSSSGLRASSSESFNQGTPGVPGANESGDNFGSALATGLLGTDSRDDLAIGVPGEDIGSAASAGGVLVLEGSSGGLTTSGAFSVNQSTSGVPGASESGDRFGSSVAIGRVDSDSIADLVIGVPDENVGSIVDAGGVVILYSKSGGPSTSGAESFHQDSPGITGAAESNDQLGSAVGVAYLGGNQGIIVVGLVGEDIGSANAAGAAMVVY